MKKAPTCRSGGTGRRAGFKIQFWQQSEGSSPSFGTKVKASFRFWMRLFLLNPGKFRDDFA